MIPSCASKKKRVSQSLFLMTGCPVTPLLRASAKVKIFLILPLKPEMAIPISLCTSR
jgi:hypothetical protein